MHQLHLGHICLPDSHPRAAERICEICSYAIDHPDGIIVVATGPRAGHPVIDGLHAPQVVSITSALASAGLDERDVVAMVNTHLHFDHCGQNHLLAHAPVWISQAELAVSTNEFYTVPEWAHIETNRLRLTADGELIADGIRILHTPGYTPGHVSVGVEADLGLEIVIVQACFSCAEFAARSPNPADMHDPGWNSAGVESIGRLRSLNPAGAHFSHNATSYIPN